MDVSVAGQAVIALTLLVAPVLAARSCWSAARRTGSDSRGWFVLGVSCAIYALANLSAIAIAVVREDGLPFPSPVDALYVGANVLMAAALVQFPLAAGRSATRPRAALETAVMATAIALVTWLFFDGRAAPDTSLAVAVLALSYPAINLLIGALAISVAVRRTPGARWPWVALGAGLATSSVTSAIYGSRALAGDVGDTTWLGAAWAIAFLLMATAARHAPSSGTEPVDRRRFEALPELVPYIPLLIVVLVIPVARERVLEEPVLYIAIAILFALVLVWQVAVVYENLALGRAVQAEADRFRQLIEQAPVAIVQIDMDGRVVLWNAEAERVTGWSVDELGGAVPPIIPADAVTGPGLRLLAGETVRNDPTDIIAKDGTRIEVAVSGSLMTGPDGHTTGILFSATDLGPTRRLERAVAETQKMHALTQLAGGVAHDFNNELAIIAWNAEFAREAATEGRHDLESLQHISDGAARAAALTDKLATFSERFASSAEELCVDDAVRSLLPMLEGLGQPGVEVAAMLDSRSAHATIDRGRLEQLLLILVTNACEAMPDGGQALIGTAITAEEPRGRTEVGPLGEHLAISVSDEGVGMDATTRSRIFEPFFTTKRRGRGSGLGLATADGIVRHLGGTITIDTARGTGATFTVHLPLALPSSPGVGEATPTSDRHDEAPADETSAAPVVPVDPAPLVLVAEDDPQLRRLAQRILEGAGRRVVLAPDGETAEGIAASQPIALLLTDVLMPGCTGPELAGRLTARRPALPVIYMTGFADDAFHEAAVGLPEDAVLRKPFTREDLLAAVERALPAGPDQQTAPTPTRL